MQPRTSSTIRTTIAISLAIAAMFSATGLLSGYYARQRSARANAHFDAGERLLDAGRGAEAVEQFRKALVFSPDGFNIRLALATALLDSGRAEEAETHLLQLQETDPASGVVNLELARAAVKRPDFESAVARYHQAIYGFWPDHPTEQRIKARWELIRLLEVHRQKRAAIAELMQLSAEVPGDAAGKMDTGAALLRLDDPVHAAEVFHEITSVHPRNAAAWAGLGEAEFAAARYAEAQQAFRRAFMIDPHNRQTLQRLAVTNAILSLDPSRPGLSASARERRSRELLERVMDVPNSCSSQLMQAQPWKAAAQLLSRKKRARGEDVESEYLAAAQQLWRDRVASCGPLRPGEEPLEILLAKASQ